MRLAFNILSLVAAIFAAHLLMRRMVPEPLDTLPAAARGLIALAILFLGLCGFAARRGKKPTSSATVRRPPSWLDRMAIGGAFIALQFGFLWLLAAAPPVIENIGIAAEPWLRPQQAAKRQDQIAASANATSQGNWLWQDRRSRTLPPRTDLRPGNRPEAFLQFDSPADAARVTSRPAYLSAFTLSKFENDWWTTSATQPTPVEASDDGVSRFPQPANRATIAPIHYAVFHGNNPSGQNVLIALHGVATAGIAPLEQYDEGFVMLPAPPDTGIGFQYPATSRPLLLADLHGDMPVRIPDNIATELTELPQDTRTTTYLTEQALAVVGQAPTIRSIAALETWLQDAFDYSLETTNPNNLDPLQNFLFAERRGHCEHFAMTGALMLRTLGLPSRVAYGWAGGTWYQASNLMVFRSREAHAWTELWLPDFGWIAIDPTPPSNTRDSLTRIAPPDELAPDIHDTYQEEEINIDTTRIDHTAAWLLAIFGLPALCIILVRSRRIRRSGNDPSLVGAAGPPSGYYEAWHTACPPHHPGETLRQQIHRLEDPPPFTRQLIGYHYRTQYQHTPSEPATERKLERDIRRWHRQQKSSE